MKSKTKIVALVMSMLICISMIGVGFAAWVIVSQASGTSTGNIKAEAITDNSVTLTVTHASDNTGIVFGGLASTDTKPEGVTLLDTIWLKNDSKTESLTVSFTLKVKGNVGKLSVGLGVATTENKDTWQQLVSNGYVTNPTYAATAGDLTITVGQDGVFHFGNDESAQTSHSFESETTITVTATFAWGSHFGGLNPYWYYNQHEMESNLSAGTTYHQDANNALGALYEALGSADGVTYTFTFTAVGADI